MQASLFQLNQAGRVADVTQNGSSETLCSREAPHRSRMIAGRDTGQICAITGLFRRCLSVIWASIFPSADFCSLPESGAGTAIDKTGRDRLR